MLKDYVSYVLLSLEHWQYSRKILRGIITGEILLFHIPMKQLIYIIYLLIDATDRKFPLVLKLNFQVFNSYFYIFIYVCVLGQ